MINSTSPFPNLPISPGMQRVYYIRLVLGLKPMVCGWPMFCVEETPNLSVIGIGKIEVLWVDLKICVRTPRFCVCVCAVLSPGACGDDKSRFPVGT